MGIEKQVLVDVKKYYPPIRGGSMWNQQKVAVRLEDDLVVFQTCLKINIHDLRGVLTLLEED